MKRAITCLALVFVLATQSLGAEVRLARVFGDHMVLQHQKPVRVWGSADAGKKVTVAFAEQTRTAQADTAGRWLVEFKPLLASSKPRPLVVKSGDRTLTIKDVLVGEVWLTPGQSNMEYPLGNTNEADIDISGADYPQIRFFMPMMRTASWGKGAEDFSPTPMDDFPEAPDKPDPKKVPRNSWIPCSPENAGRLSAVPFYFARTLHWNLKVPIGIVNPSLGGTHAHTWMQSKTVRNTPGAAELVAVQDKQIKDYESGQTHRKNLAKWAKRVAEAKAKGKKAPPRPEKGRNNPIRGRNHIGNMFNSMVVPIQRLGIRGVLYYQGENDALSGTHKYLHALFPKLIADWRGAFDDPKLPFGIVSMHGTRLYNSPPEYFANWPKVRDAHMLGHLENPDTELITACDLGDTGLHPKPKRGIGERSARWALQCLYGRKVNYIAPLFDRTEVKGGKMLVHFKSDPKYHKWTKKWSLKVKQQHLDPAAGSGKGWPLRGFIIAGSDRRFVKAKAQLISKDPVFAVEVWSDAVAKPAAVRYGWQVWPEANLTAHLRWTPGPDTPVHPFRTDDWPLK